jgi:hypothetical protein
VVITASAPGVGFAVASAPALLSIQSSGGNRQLSWNATGVLEESPSITGPWTPSADQSNPQLLVFTNSAQFYRLHQ